MTEYYGLRETATRIGVPESTLRYWRHCGSGPRGFKIGRRVVFAATEIDRFMTAAAAADLSTPQSA